MNLTSKQTAALRRLATGPATNFDIGKAIGADLRRPVQVMAIAGDRSEASEATGRIGARVLAALVAKGAALTAKRRGVPVYAASAAGLSYLAKLDGGGA